MRMKTSAYIGRIGGLAVALGIGAALSSGNGVAWADTGDCTPSHSAGSSAAATAAGGDASSTMGSRVAKPGARRTSSASTSTQPSTTSAAANSTGSTAATAAGGDVSSTTGSRAAKRGARRNIQGFDIRSAGDVISHGTFDNPTFDSDIFDIDARACRHLFGSGANERHSCAATCSGVAPSCRRGQRCRHSRRCGGCQSHLRLPQSPPHRG